jgi:hypothetical protein
VLSGFYSEEGNMGDDAEGLVYFLRNKLTHLAQDQWSREGEFYHEHNKQMMKDLAADCGLTADRLQRSEQGPQVAFLNHVLQRLPKLADLVRISAAKVEKFTGIMPGSAPDKADLVAEMERGDKHFFFYLIATRNIGLLKFFGEKMKVSDFQLEDVDGNDLVMWAVSLQTRAAAENQRSWEEFVKELDVIQRRVFGLPAQQ